MRKKIVVILATFVWLSALGRPQNPASPRYVGVKVCASCHASGEAGAPDAIGLWGKSKHAAAYQALVSSTEPQSRDMQGFRLWVVTMGNGERYGLPNPAQESKHCLPCHRTGFGAAPRLLGSEFSPADGVQCESCHGPGSLHVEARRTGRAEEIIPFKKYADEAGVKARCLSCHNGTCGEFVFEAAWPRVKHSFQKKALASRASSTMAK